MFNIRTSPAGGNIKFTKTRKLCLAICVLAPLRLAYSADEPPISQSAAQVGSSEQNLWIKMPKAEKVAFNGAVSYDSTDAKGSAMLYPAPNLIGLFAAVATHAVLATSANESKKQGLRDKADEVLVPYQEVLKEYKYQELLQSSLAKMTTVGNKKLIESTDQSRSDATIIETTSAFFMTQDQHALILDNVVSIKKSNAAGPYQVAVHVVSRVKDSVDVTKYWNDDHGHKLREESANLFANSMDIALADQANTTKNNNPYKTIRYLEGSTEKMERGQIISEHCNQMLFRNLRGNLMSVPLKVSDAETNSSNCPDANDTVIQASN